MQYIILATERQTRHTVYWGGTGEWFYNRGFAKRMTKNRAVALRKKLVENETKVLDIAVVPE